MILTRIVSVTPEEDFQSGLKVEREPASHTWTGSCSTAGGPEGEGSAPHSTCTDDSGNHEQAHVLRTERSVALLRCY